MKIYYIHLLLKIKFELGGIIYYLVVYSEEKKKESF